MNNGTTKAKADKIGEPGPSYPLHGTGSLGSGARDPVATSSKESLVSSSGDRQPPSLAACGFFSPVGGALTYLAAEDPGEPRPVHRAYTDLVNRSHAWFSPLMQHPCLITAVELSERRPYG